MPPLNISARRERALVSMADHAIAGAMALARPFRRRRMPAAPKRILLLRLERIGDLMMTLPAIADVHALAPAAEIDLIVGSWNAEIARAVPGVTRVQTLDAQWLAREHAGLGLPSLVAAARRWRVRRYDVALNFEPDIRSNLLLAASGARWTAGYASGGGGALLDVALDYDTRAHTTDNARRLVAAALDAPAQAGHPPTTLNLSDAAKRDAASVLARASGPLIGVHVSGGRAIKQWAPQRFAHVALRLIQERRATIVLTGAAGDRALVDRVKSALPPERTIDASGELDLLTLAAVLQRLALLVTGDTGPMHLAAAVGTPVVAVFGPSDPARYAPRGAYDRIVRIDLPCSPCNRIRLPPARCTGHTPDCLALIPPDAVAEAASAVLDAARGQSAIMVRNAGA